MPRDERVDFARGVALLVIFVTHVPGNPVAELSPGVFLFHDAADVFVLLAGFAVALAFGRLFEERGFLVGAARIGARIAQLYGAHLLTFIFVAGLIAWAARTFDDPFYFEAVNILPLFVNTEIALGQALLLLFQPSFLDILPLYIVLLGLFPLVALGMRIAPVVPLAGSAALWGLVQVTGLNLPNLPLNGVWFFNPFAWQLLFVIGALAGYALRDGVALPRGRGLVRAAWIAAVGLALAKAAMGHVPPLSVLAVLPEAAIVHPDKMTLSLWRVAALLAGAYLVAALVDPAASWLRSSSAQMIVCVGRHSLVVFSVGIVASMVGHVVLTETDRAWSAVALVNLAGPAGLIFLAAALEWYDRTVSRREPARGPRRAATAVTQ